MRIRTIGLTLLSIILLCGLMQTSSAAARTTRAMRADSTPARLREPLAKSRYITNRQTQALSRYANLQVRWDREKGVPYSIRGFNRQVMGNRVDAAFDFLDEIRDVYGIRNSRNEMRLAKSQQDRLGYEHVRLAQHYRGLRVFGSELIVHIDPNGKLYQVNGDFTPDIQVSTEPTITPAYAVQAGIEHAGTNAEVTQQPSLLIYPVWNKHYLAYEFVLSCAADEAWRYFVDAHTGDVINRLSEIRYIAPPGDIGSFQNMTGNVVAGEGGASATLEGWYDWTADAHYLHNRTNRWYIYNCAASGYPDNDTYAHRSTSDWGNSDPAEISAAKNLDNTQQYFETVHNRHSFDNNYSFARANVHFGTNLDNAYWDHADFHFGDGDGVDCGPLVVQDIVAHEFAHAWTEYTSGLIYQDEPGTLNESFSDIMGACVEFWAQPDNRASYPNVSPSTADWLIGEDCTITPGVTAMRDMRDPGNVYNSTVAAAGRQPSRYHGTHWGYENGEPRKDDDYGAVHRNMSVQSHMFYLLTEGGNGVNDGLPFDVSGIGLDNAAQVAYRTNTYYLVPTSTHQTARQAWIDAAGDLAMPWAQSAANAWDAVGMIEIPSPPTESFEAAAFPAGWSSTSASPWSIQSGTSIHGGQAVMSGPIPVSGATTLEWTGNVARGGVVSFFVRVSSQRGHDYLTFEVDGAAKTSWSGSIPWTSYCEYLPAGNHTLTWTYWKDSDPYHGGSDCVWLDAVCFPRVLHVSTSGSDASSGESWVMAKRTIQAALNDAQNGDEVWVAGGTYTESITLPEGISLYGGFEGSETSRAQRNWRLNGTIIQGDGQDNVVTVNTPNDDTTIDGFCIAGGGNDYAAIHSTGTHLLISCNHLCGSDAGVYVAAGRPVIINNSIQGNSYGIKCGAGSYPTTVNNTISENYYYGVFCPDGWPGVYNNIIVFNGTDLDTHGDPVGAGLVVQSSTTAVSGNDVYGNGEDYVGITAPPTDISADPLFEDAAGDYHIKPASPCKNAGDNSAPDLPLVDMDGQMRKMDGTVDIGADEIVVQTATPVFSSSGGLFNTAQTVTISCSTSGALIRFTLDGTEPDEGSALIPSGDTLNISTPSMLKAKAWHADMMPSETACAAFKFKVDTPIFAPDGGNYGSAQSVTITCPTPGAAIYYCTDGGDPDIEVVGPVQISTNTTLKARAYYDSWILSDIKTAFYKLNNVIYVALEGNDTNGGGSWADAKQTVGAAIGVASAGDEIWVKMGTYNERITLSSGVRLYGGFYGNETEREQRSWNGNETILDGGNAGTVVKFDWGAGPDTVADGFTITNGSSGQGGGIACAGNSPTIQNNLIKNNTASFDGAGIMCDMGSAPTIAFNNIRDNSAGDAGGGIMCDGDSSPTISNNWIADNDASWWGGGICCRESSPTITDNTIKLNEARLGGGIAYKELSSPSITGNTIEQNAAKNISGSGGTGGGIQCSDESTAVLTGNTFADNTADVSGGGIECFVSSPTITQNTISDNEAPSGAGIRCYDCTPTISENTIAENTATGNGGAIDCNYSGGIISGNTIRDNEASSGAGIQCFNLAYPDILNNFIQGNQASNGGGITCTDDCLPLIANNLIWDNAALYDGGGIAVNNNSVPEIVNNTIVDNSGPGVTCRNSSNAQITNNVICFNSAGVVCHVGSVPTFSHNCVYGSTGNNFWGVTDPTGTDGNISDDPSFLNRLSDDYHLSDGSPCEDTGNDSAVEPEWLDIDEESRTAGAHVDMGADEVQDVQRVAAPGFDPGEGTYDAPVDVVVTCSTDDAVIHYTINGDEPAEPDPVVASGGSVPLDTAVTLKAKAWKAGLTPSSVAAADYDFKAADPLFDPPGGTYFTPTEVTISCATPDATVRYTTDGSNPTELDPEVTGPIMVSSSVTLKAGAWRGDWTPSDIASADYVIALGQVETPTFDPDGGTYGSEQSVTVNCATAEADIHYTTDGSDPTEEDPIVDSGSTVTVDKSLTLKARAYKLGWAPSAIKTADYELKATTPAFDPAGGTYEGPKSVTISCATGGAVIHYTTDGSEPTQSDPQVSGPVLVDSSMTLKARACKTDWAASDVGTAVYEIVTDRTAAPEFDPVAGSYSAPQLVTIACSTSGTVVRYTTDGSEPAPDDPVVQCPILVGKSSTLKAKAWKTGHIPSEVSTAAYTIGGSGNVIHVKTTGSDTNDGSTWQLAKQTVQAGIDASVGGDEVWAEAGTYVECITLEAGVGLYGGFAGTETAREQRDPEANVTVMDGNNAGSVVIAPIGAGLDTVIDGFTIQNGQSGSGAGVCCDNSSPTISNNIITGNNATFSGGAVLCNNSNAVIAYNQFTLNTAGWWGGAIHAAGAAPTITGNTFTDNHGMGGAAICCAGSSGLVSGNSMCGNTAADMGGGIYCSSSAAPDITRNTIEDNDAISGGGVYCCEGSSPKITNNFISGNDAVSGAGGGIGCTGASPTIAGNVIAANSAAGDGGGVSCNSNASAVITNNTIASNTGSGITLRNSSNAQISNTIICFNSTGLECHVNSVPVLNNNCVYGNTAAQYWGVADPTGTSGNISEDPLFVDRYSGDYHLDENSGCIDAGWSGAPGVPYVDIDCDPRVYGPDSDMGADESVPMVAYAIGSGKGSGDGCVVCVEDVVVSAAFEDFFYVENEDRSCGLRVEMPGHGYTEGMRVAVTGCIQTNSHGERYIDAEHVVQTGTGTVEPVAMQNRILGGTGFCYDPITGAGQQGVTGGRDINNIGLLVRVFGAFTYVDSHTFTLDDGIGLDIKCVVPDGVTLDPGCEFAVVTGISSMEKSGEDVNRLLLVPSGGCIDDYTPEE